MTRQTAFGDGCWHDESTVAGSLLGVVEGYVGDEFAVDLELTTGSEDECTPAGRYRFERLFRTDRRTIDGGFDVVLDRD